MCGRVARDKIWMQDTVFYIVAYLCKLRSELLLSALVLLKPADGLSLNNLNVQAFI